MSWHFLIAITRIYVGVHWPFDVVVGSIVGWIVGKLVVRYDTKIMHDYALSGL